MNGTTPVPGPTINSGTSFFISKLEFLTKIRAFLLLPSFSIDFKKALVRPSLSDPLNVLN
jgi:hypothetical protein